LQVDLHSARGLSWLRLVQVVFHQALGDADLARNELVLTELAAAVTTSFILTTVADDGDPQMGVRPRIVKRVVDALDADPGRAWTAGAMAELAGVSIRRLQQGFREALGLSPFEYLFEIRLERAHEALTSAGPEATVADIAYRWGITHTGRFASAYRRRYGVTPSETLKR
jgi:transcriptional regulator GlxA family with amidase domain